MGPEERVRLKKLREAKGLKQGEIATKIDVSQGTISNMESGRHPQMARDKYAELIRVLGAESESTFNEEAFRSIVNGAVTLSAEQMALVAATIEALKKR